MKRKRNGLYGVLKKAPLDRWIAISEDESQLLGSEKKLSALIQKTEAAGHKDFIVWRTPKDWRPMI